MQKENLDLTQEKYANQSRNETTLKGIHILNGVLVVSGMDRVEAYRNPYNSKEKIKTLYINRGVKVLSRYGGKLESGELGLKVTSTSLAIPCGASARWQAK